MGLDPEKLAAALAKAKAFQGGSKSAASTPSAPVVMAVPALAVQQLLLPVATAEPQGTDLDPKNSVHQDFLKRLQDLEAALLARDPLMKTHLGTIHKTMIQYEEIVTLLRPHEIAKIMAAQQAHTNTVLVQSTTGKTGAAKAAKKAAGLTMGDL